MLTTEVQAQVPVPHDAFFGINRLVLLLMNAMHLQEEVSALSDPRQVLVPSAKQIVDSMRTQLQLTSLAPTPSGEVLTIIDHTNSISLRALGNSDSSQSLAPSFFEQMYETLAVDADGDCLKVCIVVTELMGKFISSTQLKLSPHDLGRFVNQNNSLFAIKLQAWAKAHNETWTSTRMSHTFSRIIECQGLEIQTEPRFAAYRAAMLKSCVGSPSEKVIFCNFLRAIIAKISDAPQEIKPIFSLLMTS